MRAWARGLLAGLVASVALATPVPTDATPAPITSELTVVAWNIGPQNPRVLTTLKGWVRTHHPDVIALSEAAAYHRKLRQIPGYKVFQEIPPSPRTRANDTGDVAVLVADRVKVNWDWVARMKLRWTFFKYGVRHEPHRYHVVNFFIGGQRWRIRSSHWPTYGFDGANRKAVLESARRSRHWLLNGLAPSIDVGDLNVGRSRLARFYGKRFKVFGKGVDVAVTKRVAGCQWKELPKGGSDHHGRLYEFTAKG